MRSVALCQAPSVDCPRSPAAEEGQPELLSPGEGCGSGAARRMIWLLPSQGEQRGYCAVVKILEWWRFAARRAGGT